MYIVNLIYNLHKYWIVFLMESSQGWKVAGALGGGGYNRANLAAAWCAVVELLLPAGSK